MTGDFHLNPMTGLSGMTTLKSSLASPHLNKDTSIRSEIEYLQEANGKGQTFSWGKAIHPKLFYNKTNICLTFEGGNVE